jgi:hypothetical protein
VIDVISDSDAAYLSAIENTPFAPIGWLYESIFQGLFEKGLVTHNHGLYTISELGRKELQEYLALSPRPKPKPPPSTVWDHLMGDDDLEG